MKIKISAKNFLIILSTLITVWTFISTTGESPDYVIFRAFGWKFGFNFTDNLYLKILTLGGWVLTIMMSYIIDEAKSQENV